MNEEGMLELTSKVIKDIDRYRGQMSRSEFILYLVRSYALARFKENSYVTEEEFHEFRSGVKSVLGTFLEFVVGFGMADKERISYQIDRRLGKKLNGSPLNQHDEIE